MPTPATEAVDRGRDARLEARVSRTQKSLLQRAAALSGRTLDGVKQDGRSNDIHLGRLDGVECRWLGGHGVGSWGWLSLSPDD
jgi:hypothetical protein